MTAEPIGSCPQAAASMLCRDCLELVTAGGACPRCGSSRTISHPELRELAIAHIDCDAFYAAIEKRDDPSLQDKPVIVGHAGGRGVVTTACYIARRYGPRSAMPMFRALQLCPDAVVIPPDMAKYKRASRQIRGILEAATPLIEPVSLDEAYLDLADDIRLSDRSPAVLLAGIALEVVTSASPSRSASASTSSWPSSPLISTSRAALR
jgi:DNA polymerase-4